MKWLSPEIKRCFILVPFLLLFFWMRIEPQVHTHAFVLFFAALLFVAVIPLILKVIEGRPRYGVALLWFAITILLLVEFVQLVAYHNYSEASFQREVERSTKVVQERTTRFATLAA
jgi:hypothetical protein